MIHKKDIENPKIKELLNEVIYDLKIDICSQIFDEPEYLKVLKENETKNKNQR